LWRQCDAKPAITAKVDIIDTSRRLISNKLSVCNAARRIRLTGPAAIFSSSWRRVWACVCQFCVAHRLQLVPIFHDSSHSITQRRDESCIVSLGRFDGIAQSASYVVDTCSGAQQIESQSVSGSVWMGVGDAGPSTQGQSSSIETRARNRTAGAWIQKHPLIGFGIGACIFGFQCKKKLGVD
jgi:hypothetical protein